MSEVSAPRCPLCTSAGAERVLRKRDRDFWHCTVCQLIFVPRRQHLSCDAERERYRLHRNDPADANYRASLDWLLQPLVARLASGAEGLDYGSGPHPTLSTMLTERGFRVANYDPYFDRNGDVLARTYDFVACTETVEHFARPAREFARLDALLRPGGWLGALTQMQESVEQFAEWWYHRDPTHVCFYSATTMEWIARRHAWHLDSPRPNVSLFRKTAVTG